jgi:hypothetical protein
MNKEALCCSILTLPALKVAPLGRCCENIVLNPNETQRDQAKNGQSLIIKIILKTPP